MSSQSKMQKWFKQHIADDGKPYTLDRDQAKIVLDNHKNCLVTARAGSGKTRTIVAKIAYLISYQKIPPEQIIVFSFNRKARIEVNERLSKITFDKRPLFTATPEIATTFHAFAYKILGGKKALADKIISEEKETLLFKKLYCNLNHISIHSEIESKIFESTKQFITRAEQKFFEDYSALGKKIAKTTNATKNELEFLFKFLHGYKQYLKQNDLTNFNELVSNAANKIQKEFLTFNYSYIFVDEYQDFSKLFFNLITKLRERVPNANLLAVGDDWQAINRFAGSDVKYFLNFEKFFPEDNIKLFIPTNYRSGKLIVNNANYFISKTLRDYNGCKSKNRLKAKIFYKNMQFESYFQTIRKIVASNPGKSIKLLSRNNEVSFTKYGLSGIIKNLQQEFPDSELSESTIHRSKGLEADVVILVEIDSSKFPCLDKTGGLYSIFGDTSNNIFKDEVRLFYVAITRPKEKLYILSKTPKPHKDNRRHNFFSYLNEEWLEEL